MAFGFFKKQESCDLILKNGRIYTQDPDLPWAEAVGVKDGKVLCVGDSEGVESYASPDTQIVDLEGRFLFPGFIDIHRSPVMQAFKDTFLDLRDVEGQEEVSRLLADYASENPDRQVIFGYGYRGTLPIEEGSALDSVVEDRPVVLLSLNTIDCWVNTAAKDIILETAEEEVVNVITAGYILNLLMPFDYDEVSRLYAAASEELSDHGITTVLSLQAPDYLEGLYQDAAMSAYGEGTMRQRLLTSYYLNAPINPRSLIWMLESRMTTCTELGGMIDARNINITLSEDYSAGVFTQEALNETLEFLADRKVNILLDAWDKPSLVKAYNALEYIRSKGYKTEIIIASVLELTDEDTAELIHHEDVYRELNPTAFDASPLGSACSGVEEAIDELTVYAAEMVGKSRELGSIERGKSADFCVFDENPLEKSLGYFLKMHAVMTVLEGNIVYDVDAINDEEMLNAMMEMHI